MPIDYSKGKIYKLVNDVDNEIYVGSTCQPLSKRKAQHIIASKRKANRKLYEYLNKIGWEHVDIILIENYECKNKEELHRRERYYIDTLKATLNVVIPLRTRKEYYQDNREIIISWQNQNYKDNKEDIIKQKKKYYHSHRERIQLQSKQYRENHKEELKQKRKTII